MERVCVYAGARTGFRPVYMEAARALGKGIAERGLGMVYGGTIVGLMGACADAALAGGAEVTGVLPRALTSREIAHKGITELRIVSTLHERKAVMSALSDAFIALPGGSGTLDELFEAITWRQLGLHDKPIGLLDVDGYYAELIQFIEKAAREGFYPEGGLIVRREPGALLDALLPGRSRK